MEISVNFRKNSGNLRTFLDISGDFLNFPEISGNFLIFPEFSWFLLSKIAGNFMKLCENWWKIRKNHENYWKFRSFPELGRLLIQEISGICQSRAPDCGTLIFSCVSEQHRRKTSKPAWTLNSEITYLCLCAYTHFLKTRGRPPSRS